MEGEGMSTPASNGVATSTQPARRVVASFDTYREAERAVDYLSDNGFPVERSAIVGRDLKIVEQVTGRRTWVDAAIRGMFSGAIAGFLVGWLFGLFDWFNPVIASVWLAIWGFLFGALVGSLIGLLAHWMLRGRRDFDSIGGMVADRYEVLADEEVAADAERLLVQADKPAMTTP
jgi:hypothetical protein